MGKIMDEPKRHKHLRRLCLAHRRCYHIGHKCLSIAVENLSPQVDYPEEYIRHMIRSERAQTEREKIAKLFTLPV